ncbi:FMN-binding protein [Microbacterium limosum]|uniref:FMN-binding protein n=1 Tax=Microbacterium limosum TaxID=3079935 RepID=A0AAU0MG04_9MICO|nr:FMN-binding protein [Microbacterium sp. Y20]WOQ68967.1 FMN-binding protein [Microbacterium sp. Y20]
MTRPAAARPLRLGAALVGIAGTVALAGCGATGSTTADTSSDGSSSGGSYADGTYTATGSYVTPESVETIEVTLTLESGEISAVEIQGDPQTAETQQYQSRFIGGIEDEVVGVALDDIQVDRVAGSSLTSGGFNEAVEAIKDEAAA